MAWEKNLTGRAVIEKQKKMIASHDVTQASMPNIAPKPVRNGKGE